MSAGRRTRLLADAAIALGFLAIGWISSIPASTSDPDFVYTAHDVVSVLLLALATLPYAARRAWPAAAFLVSLLSVTALWALGYNASALPLVLLVGAFWVASARRDRVVVVCAGVALVCLTSLLWADGAPFAAVEWTASIVATGGAMALGRTGRLRSELAEARAMRAEEGARRLAGEERLRISSEMHDIIGHSLGIIAVQAGVGRHLMDSDPERAAEALDNIARLSRTSLDEMRSVVAGLRDDSAAYHPAPGLADLPDLVQTARSTGLVVTLTLPEDPEEIPRQVAAATYRIAREALTNVVRHAGATTVGVAVVHHGTTVEVVIRDDGTGGRRAADERVGPGHGIIGMRERAEALGGSLSAGPVSEGGFLVAGRIPVEPVR